MGVLGHQAKWPGIAGMGESECVFHGGQPASQQLLQLFSLVEGTSHQSPLSLIGCVIMGNFLP